MLDISEYLKNAFFDSSIKKNLNIYHKNTSNKILSNENIVSESMKYTESICSQKDVRFGLFEKSQIEFQAFDIDNLKGIEFDGYLGYEFNSIDRYYVPHPSSSFTIEIENLTGHINMVFGYDISYVFAYTKSGEVIRRAIDSKVADLNYSEIITKLVVGFSSSFINSSPVIGMGGYATLIVQYMDAELNIPLGTFLVDSCKRDSSNMNIRNVIAYQVDDTKFDKSEYMHNRYNLGMSTNTSEVIDIAKYITAFSKDLKLFDASLTSLSIDISDYEKEEFWINDYAVEVIYFYVDIYDFVKLNLKSRNTVQQICDLITDGLSVYEKQFVFETISNSLYACLSPTKAAGDTEIIIGRTTEIDEYIDPYLIIGDESLRFKIKYASHFSVKNNISDDVIGVCTAYVPKIEKVTSDYFDKMIMAVERKEKGNGFYFIDNDALPDPKMLYESFCELYGYFLKIDRHGELQKIHLSSLETLYPSDMVYPRDIYPQKSVNEIYDMSMYHRCYYDEDNVFYNGIVFDYMRKGDTDGKKMHVDHYFDNYDDGKLYELNNNYIIQNAVIDQSFVGEFTPILANEVDRLKYMPFTINAIGLPHVEAGDSIQVLTSDGGFTSIVMNRTLSGIQALRDNMEAN